MFLVISFLQTKSPFISASEINSWLKYSKCETINKLLFLCYDGSQLIETNVVSSTFHTFLVAIILDKNLLVTLIPATCFAVWLPLFPKIPKCFLWGKFMSTINVSTCGTASLLRPHLSINFSTVRLLSELISSLDSVWLSLHMWRPEYKLGWNMECYESRQHQKRLKISP